MLESDFQSWLPQARREVRGSSGHTFKQHLLIIVIFVAYYQLSLYEPLQNILMWLFQLQDDFIITSVVLEICVNRNDRLLHTLLSLLFLIENIDFIEKFGVLISLIKQFQRYILEQWNLLVKEGKSLIYYVFRDVFFFEMVQIAYLIHNMILIIISSVLVVALIAVAFLKIKQKIMILGACVILLVIANLINQIYILNDSSSSILVSQSKQLRQIQKLSNLYLNSLDNDTFHRNVLELLEEQKEIMNMVVRYWSDNTFPLLHYDSLHPDRLRLILQLVNYKINSTQKTNKLFLYHIDYFEYQCDRRCFAKTFKNEAEGHFNLLVVKNVKKIEDMSIIQQSYMQFNFAVIFQNLPRNFRMHSISDLTYKHMFSDNYLPKILEQHPAKTIQYCSNYRTFDYNFYSASLKTPLIELCSSPLPWNEATSCISKHFKDQKDKIPQGWARDCLKHQNLQGVIFDNGWIKLKKQYYWGAKLKNETVTESIQQV